MKKDEAIKLYKTEFWKDMSFRDRAVFQMTEKSLCMPFGVFHEAVEKTIGRPVFTHEFGLNWDGLMKEILGEAPHPAITDIMDLIPEDKRIVIII